MSDISQTARARALDDLREGLALWPLWTKLGWNDILQRYRRSVLGPFWLTASMAVMVISLGIVYARIFKSDINDYMPFVSVSLILWSLISSMLNDSGTLFTGSEAYIKQIRLPFTVYIFRFIWSKIIAFLHNFVIYFCLLVYFGIWPGFVAFWSIPGFVLLLLNGILLGLLIGMVSARFRDVPQIVASVVQILFFLTPIVWKPEMLGHDSLVLLLNPFHHFLEIVRAPLLGHEPSLENYYAVIAMTLVNLVLCAGVFVRFRARIAYWV